MLIMFLKINYSAVAIISTESPPWLFLLLILLVLTASSMMTEVDRLHDSSKRPHTHILAQPVPTSTISTTAASMTAVAIVYDRTRPSLKMPVRIILGGREGVWC